MNKDFRYPNDNRLNSDANEYSSQNPPSSNQKGPNYYPNDNKGHYSNTNRESISKVDPTNKTHSPNSNVRTGDSLEGPVMPTSLPYDSDQDSVPNTTDQFPFDPSRTSTIPSPSYIASLTPQSFDPNPQDCPSPTPADEPTCEQIKLLIQSDTTNNTDAIEDISANAQAITKHGDVKHSSTESILGASALYFDGNGDYLSINNLNNFGSGDFTIEFWIYQPEFSQNNPNNLTQVIGQYMATRTYHNIWNVTSSDGGLGILWNDGSDEEGVGSSGSMNDSNFHLNTWTHYAFVRKDAVLSMYSNGQLIDTKAIHTKTINECPLTVGVQMYDETSPNYGQYPDNFRGYLQDLRISNKAVYTGCFVPPASFHANLVTTPNDPVGDEVALSIQSDTTNNTDAIEDVSVNAHAITKVGDTKHSSTESILGDSSLYFDGAGDYLTIDQTSDLNLNGDFTMECWVYVNSDPANAYGHPTDSHVIASCWHTQATDVNWQLVFLPGEILYAEYVGSTTIAARLPAFLNTWYHVAVVGSGNEVSLYLNGVKSTPTQGHSSYNSNLSKKIYIGSREMLHHNNQLYFDGYIQDFRISKKVVYESCFFPPSQLHNVFGSENATCDTPNPSAQVTATYNLIIPGNASHNSQSSRIIEVPIQENPGKSITYSHVVMSSAQTNYSQWGVSNLQLTAPNGSTFTPEIIDQGGFTDAGPSGKNFIISYSVPPIDFSGNWLAANKLPSLQNDNSVLFDGTQSANALTSYVPSESEGFSVSMWIKTTDQGEFPFASNHALGNFGSGTAAWKNYYGSFVFLAVSSTHSSPHGFYLLYKNKNSTARTNKIFGSTASLRDGKWHHVTATIKGTCAKIYIDGGRDASGNSFQQSSQVLLAQPNYTQEMDVSYDGGSDFAYNLGNNSGGTNDDYDFKGNKNQVAFFERELSGAEVAAIYNAGIPNDISSLNPTRLFSLSEISSDPDVTYGGATLSSDVPDDPFEYWS